MGVSIVLESEDSGVKGNAQAVVERRTQSTSSEVEWLTQLSFGSSLIQTDIQIGYVYAAAGSSVDLPGSLSSGR